MRYQSSAVVFCLSILATTNAPAQTRVVYVDASRSAGGDGITWTGAYRDLQDAFDSLASLSPEAASTLDVQFRIAGGIYRGTQNLNPAFQCPTSLSFAQSLTLTGGYAGASSPTPDLRDLQVTPTILSGDVLGNDGPNAQRRGDNCQTVLAFTPLNEFETPTTDHLVVDGLNFQSGNSDLSNMPAEAGSAVFGVNPTSIDGDATCRFVDCTFTGNSGQSAVVSLGMFSSVLSRSATTFERCLFEDNESQEAFAVVRTSNAFFTTFTDCSFITNRATPVHANGRVVMRRSRMQANHGGVFSTVAGSDVSHCLFSHNLGTALFLTGPSSVSNCTVIANNGFFGGGIFADGNLAVDYCIIVDNFAYQGGHQIAGNWSALNLGTSIVASGPDDLYFPFDPDNVPRTRPFTAIFLDPDGPDNNPDTWQDNDYRLHPHSQAIDAGSDFSSTVIDLNRNPGRVQGIIGRNLRSDLGCYESQLTLCPADINADQGVTIDDLLDFLSHFEMGQPLADLTTNGSTPFPDGGVTIDDLLFFLIKFEQGC